MMDAEKWLHENPQTGHSAELAMLSGCKVHLHDTVSVVHSKSSRASPASSNKSNRKCSVSSTACMKAEAETAALMGCAAALAEKNSPEMEKTQN